MFFTDFQTILRITIIGILAYILVIFIIRTAGKRSLSQMNAFDFVVTITLGSIIANILINQNLALFEGIYAFILIIFLQFITTSLSVKSDKFKEFIKSEPQLLFYKGEYYKKAMNKERIVTDEILQAIRSEGHGSLEDVLAVVLETDGQLSVLSHTDDESSMKDVNRSEEID